MTPGGIDLVIDGPTSADDWWVLMFEARQRWPEAIFQRLDEGEMFVYRDQEAFRAGLADDEVPSGFIHVLMGPESLTLVIDDTPTEAAAVGRELFTMFEELRGVNRM